MIVIADTTPLNYLILIDLPHILHDLFGPVIVPRAVLTEMESSLAPDKVRQWLAQRPELVGCERHTTGRSDSCAP
jgi:predicted nucleic acid-binding protein